ncbi:MAG: Bax inhibitor-1/YccA family protein [Pseudomonadota bacterium]
MRTANPALNKKTFEQFAPYADRKAMTLQGTVNRTAILLVLAVGAALWPWTLFFRGGGYEAVIPYVLGGAIAGFVVAIVTVFKRSWAVVTGPVYAILEGLFIGGISAVFEARFPGIVIQAVALTFGVLLCLLAAYTTRLIKVTQNFRLGVVAATGGIVIIYAISFIGGFFGLNVPYIHESGIIGIGFSLFVVVIAALNLVLDFDFIESGVEQGAPKYMEWYAAFGLLVTLVWLYLEILRLLAKLRGRR